MIDGSTRVFAVLGDPVAHSLSPAMQNGAFRVRGKRIERLAAQTDFTNEESAERFQRDLARLGVDQQLRRAGIGEGDTVRIGSTELEWEPQVKSTE